MMTQEEYVDGVLALRSQGKSNVEIAEQLGYHPATISSWLKKGGPPPARNVEPAEKVIDERWAERIRQLVQPPGEKLLATSVYEIIVAEGFDGSYPSVVRHLRELRGPRFRRAPAVSMPIETAPGEECQFDWSECVGWTERWGLGEVFCLGCILCWSRVRWWWFTDSIDAEHTMEGLLRFFERVGGMPARGRTDRMGALGTSQGRRFKLNPPALDFARHNGLELAVCQARDAKRKGKVERPFRDLKETFLTELDVLAPPTSVGELNSRGDHYLSTRLNARPHSTTGEVPTERLEVERRFLRALPTRRFDTAYIEDRRVHPRLALIQWDGVAYSVPPEMLGCKLVARVEVASDVLELSFGAKVVARHRLQPGATEPVWDPLHRSAAEEIALGRARPRATLEAVPALSTEPARSSGRLELGEGDYDVAPPDLEARYGACGCTGSRA